MADEAPPSEAVLPSEGRTEPGRFTQAEMDRVVSERVQRERAKFADHDDLRAKAAEFDKLQAQQQSDLDKAVAAARKEGGLEALGRANARVVSAEARALAAAAKFHDPLDAVAHLRLDDVKVNDDGTVDDAAIRSRLDELIKSKPYLVADAEPAPAGKPKPDPAQGARTDDDGKGVAGGRERGRKEREDAAAKLRNPFEGMTVVGLPRI